MENAVAHAARVGELAHLPAIPAIGRSERLVARARDEDAEGRRGEILSRHQFLQQLRIEKRRADRSKMPLSLVLFGLSPGAHDQPGNLRALVDPLSRVKRETDILGDLGEGVIGLLLTHTDSAGVRGFTESMQRRAGGLNYAMSSGTYPDQIFKSVVAHNQDLPDTLPFFLEHAARHGALQLGLKRCVDVVGAMALLILASPIMLVTAIAIKATSPGPVIYKQTRLGRRGAPFVFYKFRSMRTNSDDRIHREYVTNLINGRHEEINQGQAHRPHYKLKSDPRVTPVGKIIRITSIDELPQLYNVLKGDMSLVGPRPPIPYEAEKYQSWHLRRVLEGRPGITGLWQVEGRNRVSFDDMVRLDLRYRQTWSLWLDLKILARTVVAVLRCDGQS